MIINTQQSLQRCDKLSKKDELITNRSQLIELFLGYFGNIIMTQLVNITGQCIPELNRKTQLNDKFFEIIPLLNTLISRIDLLFSVYTSKFELKEIEYLENKKESIIQTLEIKIKSQVQNALASIYVNCNRILNEMQNPKDFLLDTEGEQRATNACMEFVSFMRKYIKQIKRYSSQINKQRLLDGIGDYLV